MRSCYSYFKEKNNTLRLCKEVCSSICDPTSKWKYFQKIMKLF